MLFSFFFNDTATTETYTLSLHDALPILGPPRLPCSHDKFRPGAQPWVGIHLNDLHAAIGLEPQDRKSTRLNSSHEWISYAVFCLKKKNFQCISTCPRCILACTASNLQRI